ncbi:MAG: hypothetical protein IT449_05155 [Phycisphaerales bacterium]|nr:hypothetical protein [Phycisphaerales bacterium]
MAGRPRKMLERVDRLEGLTYAVLTRLGDACPEMYKGKDRGRGRPDTLARLWQKALGDLGEAYGSILTLTAALAEKAEGKRLDPREYREHLER